MKNWSSAGPRFLSLFTLLFILFGTALSQDDPFGLLNNRSNRNELNNRDWSNERNQFGGIPFFPSNRGIEPGESRAEERLQQEIDLFTQRQLQDGRLQHFNLQDGFLQPVDFCDPAAQAPSPFGEVGVVTKVYFAPDQANQELGGKPGEADGPTPQFGPCVPCNTPRYGASCDDPIIYTSMGKVPLCGDCVGRPAPGGGTTPVDGITTPESIGDLLNDRMNQIVDDAKNRTIDEPNFCGSCDISPFQFCNTTELDMETFTPEQAMETLEQQAQQIGHAINDGGEYNNCCFEKVMRELGRPMMRLANEIKVRGGFPVEGHQAMSKEVIEIIRKDVAEIKDAFDYKNDDDPNNTWADCLHMRPAVNQAIDHIDNLLDMLDQMNQAEQMPALTMELIDDKGTYKLTDEKGDYTIKKTLPSGRAIDAETYKGGNKTTQEVVTFSESQYKYANCVSARSGYDENTLQQIKDVFEKPGGPSWKDVVDIIRAKENAELPNGRQGAIAFWENHHQFDPLRQEVARLYHLMPEETRKLLAEREGGKQYVKITSIIKRALVAAEGALCLNDGYSDFANHPATEIIVEKPYNSQGQLIPLGTKTTIHLDNDILCTLRQQYRDLQAGVLQPKEGEPSPITQLDEITRLITTQVIAADKAYNNGAFIKSYFKNVHEPLETADGIPMSQLDYAGVQAALYGHIRDLVVGYELQERKLTLDYKFGCDESAFAFVLQGANLNFTQNAPKEELNRSYRFSLINLSPNNPAIMLSAANTIDQKGIRKLEGHPIITPINQPDERWQLIAPRDEEHRFIVFKHDKHNPFKDSKSAEGGFDNTAINEFNFVMGAGGSAGLNTFKYGISWFGGFGPINRARGFFFWHRAWVEAKIAKAKCAGTDNEDLREEIEFDYLKILERRKQTDPDMFDALWEMAMATPEGQQAMAYNGIKRESNILPNEEAETKAKVLATFMGQLKPIADIDRANLFHIAENTNSTWIRELAAATGTLAGVQALLIELAPIIKAVKGAHVLSRLPQLGKNGQFWGKIYFNSAMTIMLGQAAYQWGDDTYHITKFKHDRVQFYKHLHHVLFLPAITFYGVARSSALVRGRSCNTDLVKAMGEHLDKHGVDIQPGKVYTADVGGQSFHIIDVAPGMTQAQLATRIAIAQKGTRGGATPIIRVNEFYAPWVEQQLGGTHAGSTPSGAQMYSLPKSSVTRGLGDVIELAKNLEYEHGQVSIVRNGPNEPLPPPRGISLEGVAAGLQDKPIGYKGEVNGICNLNAFNMAGDGAGGSKGSGGGGRGQSRATASGNRNAGDPPKAKAARPNPIRITRIAAPAFKQHTPEDVGKEYPIDEVLTEWHYMQEDIKFLIRAFITAANKIENTAASRISTNNFKNNGPAKAAQHAAEQKKIRAWESREYQNLLTQLDERIAGVQAFLLSNPKAYGHLSMTNTGVLLIEYPHYHIKPSSGQGSLIAEYTGDRIITIQDVSAQIRQSELCKTDINFDDFTQITTSVASNAHTHALFINQKQFQPGNAPTKSDVMARFQSGELYLARTPEDVSAILLLSKEDVFSMPLDALPSNSLLTERFLNKLTYSADEAARPQIVIGNLSAESMRFGDLRQLPANAANSVTKPFEIIKQAREFECLGPGQVALEIQMKNLVLDMKRMKAVFENYTLTVKNWKDFAANEIQRIESGHHPITMNVVVDQMGAFSRGASKQTLKNIRALNNKYSKWLKANSELGRKAFDRQRRQLRDEHYKFIAEYSNIKRQLFIENLQYQAQTLDPGFGRPTAVFESIPSRKSGAPKQGTTLNVGFSGGGFMQINNYGKLDAPFTTTEKVLFLNPDFTFKVSVPTTRVHVEINGASVNPTEGSIVLPIFQGKIEAVRCEGTRIHIKLQKGATTGAMQQLFSEAKKTANAIKEQQAAGGVRNQPTGRNPRSTSRGNDSRDGESNRGGRQPNNPRNDDKWFNQSFSNHTTPPIYAYPIPTSGRLVIEGTLDADAQLVLEHVSGGQVAIFSGEQVLHQGHIDLSPYAPGMYLLHVQSGAVRQTLRVVRE